MGAFIFPFNINDINVNIGISGKENFKKKLDQMSEDLRPIHNDLLSACKNLKDQILRSHLEEAIRKSYFEKNKWHAAMKNAGMKSVYGLLVHLYSNCKITVHICFCGKNLQAVKSPI